MKLFELGTLWKYLKYRVGWVGFVKAFAILIFMFLCFFPLLSLFQTALQKPAKFSDILFNHRQLNLFWRSLLFSLIVSIFCNLLGFFAAMKLYYWRSVLRWVPLIFLALPPYIQALSWLGVFQSLNKGLITIGFSSFRFTGWLISGFVQLLFLLPLAYGIALFGLETLDPELIAVGRTHASDVTVLKQIILPLVKPFLVAGLSLVFLFSLLDYSIPYLFAVNVYALEIFASFSANADVVKALMIALPMLVVSVSLIGVTLQQLKHAGLKPKAGQAIKGENICYPKIWVGLFRFSLVILLIQMVMPLFSTLFLAGSWQSLLASIEDGLSEATYSLIVAFVTALLCLPLAAVVAKWVRGPLGWFLVLFPLSVPPSLVGIGEISAWNRANFNFLYNTDWIPIFTHMAMYLPMAVILLKISYLRLDHQLMDAARVYQPGSLRRWLQIEIPLLAPGFFSAMILVIVFSLGELSAIMLVLPPGRLSLTLRIFNFLHYGAADSVAGLSLFLILLAIVGGGLSFSVVYFWNRYILTK